MVPKLDIDGSSLSLPLFLPWSILIYDESTNSWSWLSSFYLSFFDLNNPPNAFLPETLSVASAPLSKDCFFSSFFY